MTLTACGPVCDVGGEYILLEDMEQFSVNGSGTLLVCETHKSVLTEAGDKNDWTVLPDGPLRRGYENATRQQQAECGAGAELQ